ncbi:MAG: DUF6088 family protein [Spirochaetales bacterium]|jgi:hypothetical protein
MTNQSVFDKVVSRIYGHGRGFVFSGKDFSDLAKLETINKTLLRLYEKGTIRRILRGVYYYPKFSTFLNEFLSATPKDVAIAISRSHGWKICASGNAALNMLGLSRQVPAVWNYLSDGPSRTYAWSGLKIKFIHKTNKEISVLSPTTALVVQALKALGARNIDDTVIETLKKALSDDEKKQTLREAQYVTSWVYEAIKRIANDEGASLA